MSETKHSPGPWQLSGRGQSYGIEGIYINAPGFGSIASVYTITKDHDANARLIAAAPELLAMVKELVRWYWDGYSAKDIQKVLKDTRGPSKKAIALIEQASGEKLEDFI